MGQIVAFIGVNSAGAPYPAMKSIIFSVYQELCENIVLGLSEQSFPNKKLAS